MCECGVATGSCVQILDFITERGSCYVVAAGNLRTDFRFWCGAAKLDVNGFLLHGAHPVQRGGELKNFTAITGHGFRMSGGDIVRVQSCSSPLHSHHNLGYYYYFDDATQYCAYDILLITVISVHQCLLSIGVILIRISSYYTGDVSVLLIIHVF